ncbi:hypothetical protein AOLI_G00070250 [Acnodon oligacanthus]
MKNELRSQFKCPASPTAAGSAEAPTSASSHTFHAAVMMKGDTCELNRQRKEQSRDASLVERLYRGEPGRLANAGGGAAPHRCKLWGKPESDALNGPSKFRSCSRVPVAPRYWSTPSTLSSEALERKPFHERLTEMKGQEIESSPTL